MAAVDTSLQRSYRLVQEYIINQEYEKAIKILKDLPVDVDRTKALVYCSLQCERWSTAQTALNAYDSLKSNNKDYGFAFERAYIYYKLNRLNIAYKTIQSAKPFSENQTLAALHLEAQVSHRLGLYAESLSIYQDLLRNDPNNEMLLCNYIAALSCHMDINRNVNIPDNIAKLLESENYGLYEYFFNKSCWKNQQKDYKEAEVLLVLARDKCAKECNVKDPTSSQVYEYGELINILVQLAYVYDIQNRSQEAISIYEATIHRLEEQQNNGAKRKGAAAIDASVAAIALTNSYLYKLKTSHPSLLVDKKHTLSYALDDAIKRATRLSGQSLEHRLSLQQRIGIGLARCLCLLQEGKYEACKRLLTSYAPRTGRHPEFECLRAALQIKGGRLAKAEEILRTINKRQDLDKSIILRVNIALASLRLKQGDKCGASKLLKEVQSYILDDIKPDESLTLDLFYLQKQCGDTKGILETLNCRARTLSTKQDLSPEQAAMYISTLLTAGAFNASLSLWSNAAEEYNTVLKALSESRFNCISAAQRKSFYINALLGLTQVYCQSEDPQSIKFEAELAKELPEQIALLDSDEVEKQEVATAIRSKYTKETNDSNQNTLKRKRKRKIRYPKGFDPSKPQILPDPERWLPKHERSGYKKMLRRRKECARGGAQGAILPNTSEATTGFRQTGPSTANTEAARSNMRNTGGRRKVGRR